MASSHLLLVPFPAWGHCRPLYALATRLVSEADNVIVTILVSTTDTIERSRFEIERQFEPGSTALQRIRLISINRAPQGDLMAAMVGLEKLYPAAYKALAQSEPITCAETGVSFEAISAPVSVITDFVSSSTLKSTRSVTGRSVPVVAWVTVSGASLIRIWGPEHMGGLGNFGAKLEAEVARTGKSAVEVGGELIASTKGQIIKIPGVPAMYGYEFFPQTWQSSVASSSLLISSYGLLMDSDAILMAGSDAFEQESLNAVREWFSSLNKSVYVVGPLVPTEDASSELDTSNSDDVKVATFLDSILNQHGAHSLVFISFGSMVWPENVEYLREVVEALLEKDIPFILSHAASYGEIPSELLQKLHSSESVLLTSWSPQQFILDHPATGWFLSHGGYASVVESLSGGVPLICWPFASDQPITSAHVTEDLKVGFELFEVRTGDDGLKPLHRNGLMTEGTREAVGIEFRRVLEACFGVTGEEMRRRANKLKNEFYASWEVNGTSKVTLNKFLERYACVNGV